MRKSLSSTFLLVLMACAAVLGSGPGEFRFVGQTPFATALNFATAGDRIYLLSSGLISVLEVDDSTDDLTCTQTVAVNNLNRIIAAQDNLVALSTLGGDVTLFGRHAESLTARSSLSIADTCLDLEFDGELLVAACGTDGITIFDVGDSGHPAMSQNLDQAAYATKVETYRKRLYVLDALNGVLVYDKIDSGYEYAGLVRINRPVRDIAGTSEGVAVAFGDQRLEFWRIPTGTAPTLSHVSTASINIEFVDSDPDHSNDLILGGSKGEIAVYTTIGKSQRIIRNIGAKITHLDFQQMGRDPAVLALDLSGRLSLFLPFPSFEISLSYAGGDSPSSLTVSSQGLLMATPVGIESISANSETVDRRLILEGGQLYTAMAIAGSFLFAGTADGTISVYEYVRGNARPVTVIVTSIPVNKIFVSNGEDGTFELVLVGERGAYGYELTPDFQKNLLWSIEADNPITTSDYSESLLVLSDERGNVCSYDVSSGQPVAYPDLSVSERPRDIEIIDRSTFVVAQRDGLGLYQFSADDSAWVGFATPSAIGSAYDLKYDPTTKELLIAGGEVPVKYLDLTNLANLGAGYIIEGTGGTTRIELAEGNLYCFSQDWLRVYERTRRTPGSPTLESGLFTMSIFPNPFNISTAVLVEFDDEASIPQTLNVTLYNILGQKISGSEFNAYARSTMIQLSDLAVDPSQLATGIYFFAVKAVGQTQTRKLMFLK